jgi:hypothetical protein
VVAAEEMAGTEAVVEARLQQAFRFLIASKVRRETFATAKERQ